MYEDPAAEERQSMRMLVMMLLGVVFVVPLVVWAAFTFGR